MAEQGLGLGAPRLGGLQGSVLRVACLGCLTRIACAAKLAGYRSVRVEPPAPTPNKTKSQSGLPVAQHLPTDGPPPRRNPTFPVNTHLHQQQAKRGRPTRPSRNIHSFCIFNTAVATDTGPVFECCTSFEQAAVHCALSPQAPRLSFPIFLLIFCISLFAIPNPQHEPVLS